MDTLGSSMSGLSMDHQQLNSDATISRPIPDIIDLTGDSDSGSGSELEEELPQSSSALALAISTSAENTAIDTLDISKLSYNFKMLGKNSIQKPIKQQFISVRSFIGRLDKNNKAYEFTASQYRRAWEHAVRLQENEVAINEIVQKNPNLDAAGIEALFTQQMQQVIYSINLVFVQTRFERDVQRHKILNKRLHSALERGTQKGLHKLENRLAALEREHGIAPNPAYRPRPKRSMQHNRDIYNGEAYWPNVPTARSGNGSGSRKRKSAGGDFRTKSKKAKKSTQPKENYNTMPLAYNRLGDRVIKSPTPKQEVENPLALAAWQARANMTTGPVIQTSPGPKPVLVPSSMYYGHTYNENTRLDENSKLPESRDEQEEVYFDWNLP